MKMTCDDFLYFMGVGTHYSTTDIVEAVKFNATNRIISGGIVFIITIYFLILHIFFKKKIKEMINSSVFSIFDDLSEIPFQNMQNTKNNKKNHQNKLEKGNDGEIFKTLKTNSDEISKSTSFPSFDKNHFKLMNKEIALALQNESIDLEGNEKNVYLCDFDECCCECCCKCWYITYYGHIKRNFLRFCYKFECLFKKNLKPFCFYFLMIGTFVYNPLRNLLSFVFNSCNLDPFNTSSSILLVFNLIDLFCGTFVFVLYFFLISFLNTEAEFLKIYLFDKSYRARLTYYHLKKALILGVFHFLLKFAYKLGMDMLQNPFDNIENPSNAIWLAFKDVFLLISMKLYANQTNNSIDQDCKVLRAHARYFTIQSHLINGIPRALDIYKILKKEVSRKDKDHYILNFNPKLTKLNIEENEKPRKNANIITLLLEKLTKKCKKTYQSICEELCIIEIQKFKNVLRNKGALRYVPRFFTFILCMICVVTIFICSLLIMIITKHIPHPKVEEWAYKSYAIVWCCECTVLPFFIYYSLKKETYLPLRKVKMDK